MLVERKERKPKTTQRHPKKEVLVGSKRDLLQWHDEVFGRRHRMFSCNAGTPSKARKTVSQSEVM